MEGDNVDLVDMRTEEDKMPAEANRKRKLKTPAQLQALEEYYEDHKYPTESLKSEIAEKLGLTEKQVSGWFCHRRLKDKRLSKDEAFGNGRVDRSSGVIQEHGSEPGQDSCGSTKPGGYKYMHADLREVESEWLADQEFSPKNLGCHKRMSATRLDYDMDETSSESSSPLRPSDLPQCDVPQMWDNLKHGVALPLNSKIVIGKQLRRPSGYLKLKPKAEHPAISAVKRQLGNKFRVDGPPLGIEFDPLPIDAFQAAPKVIAKGAGLSYGTDSPSFNISGRGGADSRLKMPKGIYKPDDIYREEQSPGVNNESEVCYSHHQPKSHTYARNNGKLHHGWDPSSNLDREYAEETYGSKRDSKGAKYSSKGLHIQPISSGHFSPCAETVITDQTDVSLHNIRYANPKNAQRTERLKNQLSNRKHMQRETHDTFERRPCTKEPEIEKLPSVTSYTSDRHNLVSAMATPDYELTDDYPGPYKVRDAADNNLKEKNVQHGYPHPLQDFTEKAPLPVKYDRGPAEEFPSNSSSSEDETGETSSSDDDDVE